MYRFRFLLILSIVLFIFSIESIQAVSIFRNGRSSSDVTIWKLRDFARYLPLANNHADRKNLSDQLERRISFYRMELVQKDYLFFFNGDDQNFIAETIHHEPQSDQDLWDTAVVALCFYGLGLKEYGGIKPSDWVADRALKVARITSERGHSANADEVWMILNSIRVRFGGALHHRAAVTDASIFFAINGKQLLSAAARDMPSRHHSRAEIFLPASAAANDNSQFCANLFAALKVAIPKGQKRNGRI